VQQPAFERDRAGVTPLAAVRGARERVLAGGADPFGDAALRRDIACSWRRSLRMGVGPDSIDVPYDDAIPTPHRLLDAALPVIDRLAAQLTDSSATILLANGDAQIVQRWACHSFLPTLDRFNVAPGFTFAEHRVGTNGLGCALEEKRLFEVRGPEHFRECLQALVCVAAPIVLPTTNVAQGALNVTCTLREANGLLRPLIQEAVADIERRMLEAASLPERLVLDAFISKARGAHGAVLATSADLVMANAAADRLVSSSDRQLLWHWAREALMHRDSASRTIELTGIGRAAVAATKVGDATPPLAAVLEIRLPEANRLRQASVGHEPFVDAIPGRSPASRRLRRAAAAAARDASNAVVIGPEGSGRTFVARVIATGGRLDGPPAVLLHDGAGGLDARLGEGHRTLVAPNIDTWESRDVNRLFARAGAHGARVIATANDRSSDADSVQRFDHRVEVSSLAHRLDDLPELAARLLAELAGDGGRPRLRPATLEALLSHDWPGNVRELRSVLSAALAAAGGSDIAVFHLPASFREEPHGARWTSIEAAERNAIMRALNEHDGNKVAATAALGLARSTLYRKLRALHIEGA
jgi:transcriptional regulator of acetoin/glycerol metabolism